MNSIDLSSIPGAEKLTPLQMNSLQILKAHTVITFNQSASKDPNTPTT